jgi:hypothetical protein
MRTKKYIGYCNPSDPLLWFTVSAKERNMLINEYIDVCQYRDTSSSREYPREYRKTKQEILIIGSISQESNNRKREEEYPDYDPCKSKRLEWTIEARHAIRPCSIHRYGIQQYLPPRCMRREYGEILH